ncbi:ATP-dependent Clp protease adapter ClpS [Agromyces seonyuensis]|uniref:ATP-dependent Clp protease adapter protein ClpS n=1 Tax=Agromyces seonyuensis TaxID=2662446 RepID=A0A6I4NV02_9MICO|nr:ATP-dependent Clp protease adapter ClpS [Agromyces seonyuensis]MWB97921.1 ATP-dependent Clp protease adapter ClpS [Agromyces seonyuensis]
MTQTIERPEVEQETRTALRPDLPWQTIVWDDPVNLMTYVSYVFRTHFGFTPDEAERRMLLVHHEGRAVVASGPRESMEAHVEAMHGYGLQATVQRSSG